MAMAMPPMSGRGLLGGGGAAASLLLLLLAAAGPGPAGGEDVPRDTPGTVVGGNIVGDMFDKEAVVTPHGAMHPANLSFRMALMVVAVFIAIFAYLKPQFPGKLPEQGVFNCEDPGLDYDDPTSLTETIKGRRRDFCRIVQARRDLWLLSETSRSLGALIPVDVADDFDGSDEAVATVYAEYKEWLQNTLKQIPGGTWESGNRGLGWPVIDRVVHTVCVSPEYEFLRTYKVEPWAKQSKWVMMISKKGAVRIAWYAFITDKVKPGMQSGPFVVRMVTEDLNTDKKTTWTEYFFKVRSTGRKDIKEVVAKDVKYLLEAVDTDDWTYLCPSN